MNELDILAVGDEFVLPGLFTQALRDQLGDAPVRELALPWPSVPFGPVSEVDEAAGDEEALIAALPGAEVAVTQLAPFTEKVFASAPQLRLVAVSRGGPVNVNLEAATRHGVAVCYAPGRNANAVAEFTIGLIIAACRNIATGRDAIAAGDWHERYFEYGAAGSEIQGSTVGLIGYSAVGRLVARLLTAFGATVKAYDPFVDASRFEPGVEKVDDLETLLATSQIVSLHQRLTPQTRGMIAAEQLAAMPRGSVLINTARGGVLDYEALCDSLDAGHLGGAGLDVHPTEPLPADARLRRTPNVVLTPHIAGCSREVAKLAATICAAEVGRWRRGEPLANCANPEVLKET
ncbi:2-hydroxyacid dehydrogenase [Stackebrandtia nassauensis]|uniref:D-isomer specific 2-hydroxyacid dehydrogenase NAD-binding protein n=1 Tax=Stackebrandtia nassauensis (strain DSM 44728 / CIP 108903 / NRRL B-16338 / NBRC 102104 / LLR-40K-21) TaxID=446470 RepID=D3Q0X1_STANL|nr:2-hydroxyacid dehydrogenase [Stackebrandtia nassauensis]ADD43721.1 D-isomer specific 2-hydroxyacid dehydrogenase NAD-binding protein [Stackebrandtia nassauensis DSM 44728]